MTKKKPSEAQILLDRWDQYPGRQDLRTLLLRIIQDTEEMKARLDAIARGDEGAR